MVHTKLKDNLLNVITEYADSFIEMAIESPQGIYWNSQKETSGQVRWNNPENIEDGNAGIVLFLLELYHQSKDEKHLETAKKATDWLLDHCKNVATNNYSFFTGRAGVSYVLLQIAAITKDKKYLRQAFRVLKDAKENYLYSDYVSDGLYDGRAGTLLVFLHLYHATGKESILDYVNLFADKIIENLNVNNQGIHWEEKDNYNVRASCSFTNGTAGIGFVFGELASYFSNPIFAYIQNACLRYDDSCWDAKENTWLNYTGKVVDEETHKRLIDAYKNKNLTFFETPDDCSSWSEGAVGIALARLHSLRINHNEKQEQEVKMTIDKLMSLASETSFTSYDLFKGKEGLGVFFIEAFKYFNDEKLLSFFSSQFPEQPQLISGKQDGGLARGPMSTAYLFLQLNNYDEKSSPNILMPYVERNKSSDESLDSKFQYTIADVKEKICLKYFKRTLLMLKKEGENALLEFQNDGHELNAISEFMTKVETFLAEADETSFTEGLKEIYRLDEMKYEMLSGSKNNMLNKIKNYVSYHETIRVFNQDEWLGSRKIKLSNNIKTISNQWFWEVEKTEDRGEILNVVAQPNEMIVYQLNTGVIFEIPKITIQGLIISLLDKPETASFLVEKIITFCKSHDEILLRKILENSIHGLSAAVRKNMVDFVGSDNLYNRLDYIVTYRIKELICGGVIVFE